MIRPELKKQVGAIDGNNLILKVFNTCLFDLTDYSVEEGVDIEA